MRSYHPAKFAKIWISVEKFKFSQILLGDKNATSLCSKNISTLCKWNAKLKSELSNYKKYYTCILLSHHIIDVLMFKVEIFLEQREVAFLSPSKICENFNFSTEIQIFANFAGW